MRYRRLRSVCFVLCFLFCLSALVSAQTTRFVPGSGFTSIQSAIDASADGDEVVVSAGTFFENLNFNGKNITVRGAWGAQLTIIDGNQNGPCVTFENGETNGAVLSDVTLTNGRGADGDANSMTLSNTGTAGGIWIDGATPLIRKCIISNNTGGDCFGSVSFAGDGGIGMVNSPGFQFGQNGKGGKGGKNFGDITRIESCKILGNFGGHVQSTFNPINKIAASSANAGDGGPDAAGGTGGIGAKFGSTFSMRGCLVKDNVGGDAFFSFCEAGTGGVSARFSQPFPILMSDCGIRDNCGGSCLQNSFFSGTGGIDCSDAEIDTTIVRANKGGDVFLSLDESAGNDGAAADAGHGGIRAFFVHIRASTVKENKGGNIVDQGFAGELDGFNLTPGTGGIRALGNAIVDSCFIVQNTGGDLPLFLNQFPNVLDGFLDEAGVGALDIGSFSEVIRSTIADNQGGIGGLTDSIGGIVSDGQGTDINSSIVWGNRGFVPGISQTVTTGPGTLGINMNSIQLSGSSFNVSFSNIESGMSAPLPSLEGVSASTNISVDPEFVDPSNCDYHLLPTSPCINTGDPSSFIPMGSRDVDEDPRPIGGTVDMGGDEFNLGFRPGSGADLILEYTINFWGNRRASVRYIESGDFLLVGVLSPGGTYVDPNFMLMGVPFATGNPPAMSPGMPDFHLGTDMSAIMDLSLSAFAVAPFPDARFWGFKTVGGMFGMSLMMQGFAMDASASSGMVATDAHELRFR